MEVPEEHKRLATLCRQLRRLGPCGEHSPYLHLSLFLGGTEWTVEGRVWLDWKCEHYLFENVPVNEALKRLERIVSEVRAR